MSRFALLQSLLGSAQRISAPGSIQLAKRSAARLPHSAEAMALTVSALGALDRHTGVHTINLNLDGKLHAIALIEGATFEEREGTTALIQVEPKETP